MFRTLPELGIECARKQRLVSHYERGSGALELSEARDVNLPTIFSPPPFTPPSALPSSGAVPLPPSLPLSPFPFSYSAPSTSTCRTLCPARSRSHSIVRMHIVLRPQATTATPSSRLVVLLYRHSPSSSNINRLRDEIDR
ncbi:unnamed protein product [Cyclocybe aegerita]|uniref:Uncharacterized protein n=1 Tax=Cyclocybe aegerita TaxID=1973307 RepID=A0A8S0W3C3_CYCAE|nr:unnamed protein product [Cyclocybe aegerita]